MKRQPLLATLMLAAGSLLLQPAFAEDAHHPDQKAGAAAPAADQTIQKIQANTRKMQAQLEKMARSKDPKERQQLMQEDMAGGMDCPMMPGGMGGMGMMGQGGMGPDAMTNRMQMMEKRMDMMQMMLEQMTKQPAPAK